MRKRIITLCMAVMLLAVFAVSSFAANYCSYNGVELPDISDISGDEFLIIYDSTNLRYELYAMRGDIIVTMFSESMSALRVEPTDGSQIYHYCPARDDQWLSFGSNSSHFVAYYVDTAKEYLVWSSIDLHVDGVTYFAASEPDCGGSSDPSEPSEPVDPTPSVPVDPTDPVGSADISAITSQLTGQINVQHTVSVIALAVTACVGLVFMWWGLRKAIAAIMAAFRKGKINL